MSITEFRPICLVEDDDDVRDSLRLLLESAGYLVQAFSDAEDFLEAGDGRHAGCLLMDLHLPGMSGIELLETVRRNGVKTPAILLTASGQEMDNRLMLANLHAVVPKPPDPESLLELVQKACSVIQN